MFGKYAKGAETPRFRRGTEPPPPCRSLRPCLVDGKPATFHRWVDADRALLKINAFVRAEEQGRLVRGFRDDAVVPNCCSTEVIRETVALVEYPDGSVGKVKPELITFMDRKED